jgi:anti-sigma regulatory factor (Ser/Thr protein kinase)
MSDAKPRGVPPPAVPRPATYAPAPVASLSYAPTPISTSETAVQRQAANHALLQVGSTWPLQTRLELAAFPSAVSCARGHVRSVVWEWGLAYLADTAELLTSELVTNAVQASERLKARVDLLIMPIVRLWLISDRNSLIIHVWDVSSRMPSLCAAEPDAEGGRGLLLVDALSADWGAYRKADGKVVWVMIGSTHDP